MNERRRQQRDREKARKVERARRLKAGEKLSPDEEDDADGSSGGDVSMGEQEGEEEEECGVVASGSGWRGDDEVSPSLFDFLFAFRSSSWFRGTALTLDPPSLSVSFPFPSESLRSFACSPSW